MERVSNSQHCVLRKPDQIRNTQYSPRIMTVYYGCDIPEELYYHPEQDCWIRFEGADRATLGMTDVAQTLAGRLMYVRFKAVGRMIKAGKIAATIESAKWIGPFRMPFDAELLEVNQAAFTSDILTANKDPYGAGWLVKVRLLEPANARQDLITGKEAVAFLQKKIDDQKVRCFRCVD